MTWSERWKNFVQALDRTVSKLRHDFWLNVSSCFVTSSQPEPGLTLVFPGRETEFTLCVYTVSYSETLFSLSFQWMQGEAGPLFEKRVRKAAPLHIFRHISANFCLLK